MGSTQKLLSVVTISYNQRDYLQQALDSVISQLDDATEYIVMDGGSTDGSVELLQSYENHFSYWQSCPDGGPASALQAALDRCSGKFLMYINSDDFYLPGTLDYFRKQIVTETRPDVFYGNGYTFDERNDSIRRTFSDRWNTRAYAKGSVSIFQQSCCLRLDSVRRVGGFNTENRTCWDGELLFDMARSGAVFKRLSPFLAVFRLHSQSISGGQSSEQRYQKDCERIANKLGDVTYKRPGLLSTFEKLLRQPDIMIGKLVDSVRKPADPSVLHLFESSHSNSRR